MERWKKRKNNPTTFTKKNIKKSVLSEATSGEAAAVGRLWVLRRKNSSLRRNIGRVVVVSIYLDIVNY